MRRWPMLVLIPGLLVGALVFDQRTDTERSRRAKAIAPVAEVAQLQPIGSPSDALSSTWYCAGGTATAGGMADHAVVISNPTAAAARGTVTAVPSKGRSVTKQVTVAAYSRVRVTLRDLLTAPYAAAQVEFLGGRVVVEHEVAGPDGIDAAPCASAASSTWYFASGATTQNAKQVLALFNPFPDSATVDISFATPQGRRTPPDVQGFQVPGGSVVAVDVNSQARVDSQVSTSIVARAGRIVVDRIQSFDGSPSTAASKDPYQPKGLTVALGVPTPLTTWMFPVGIKDEGAHERFVVFNPTSQEAEVDLSIALSDPQVNGELDPFSLSVAPGGYQVLELDDEDRVPTRVDHAAVAVSTNGVPIVVDRMFAGLAPFSGQGTGVSSGSALVAPKWVFASGGNVPNRLSQRIAVQNPSAHAVTVKVAVMSGGRLAPIPGIGPVTLAAHAHAVIRFGDKVDDRQVSVVVSASGPIAAERLLFRIGETGLSTAIGIPSPVGAVRVPASAAG